MHKYVVIVLGVFGVFLLSFCSANSSTEEENAVVKPKVSGTKIGEAIVFAKNNEMDTTIVVFVDFSIPSGKNRLFVYDVEKKVILKSALCAHGSGNGSYSSGNEVIFSNVPESHYSSIGKYKIGDRGWSNWGIHVNYRLHGLEKTNSNAFKRVIVLHSYERVEEEEIYPEKLINSWGCPMVSNNTMKFLDKELKQAQLPVLLWIYD